MGVVRFVHGRGGWVGNRRWGVAGCWVCAVWVHRGGAGWAVAGSVASKAADALETGVVAVVGQAGVAGVVPGCVGWQGSFLLMSVHMSGVCPCMGCMLLLVQLSYSPLM